MNYTEIRIKWTIAEIQSPKEQRNKEKEINTKLAIKKQPNCW